MLSTRRYLWVFFGLIALTIWAYLPPLGKAAQRWSNDPQYSHGFLVPVFSAYLLYSRREMLSTGNLNPSWWGVVPLAVAGVLRWFEAVYFYNGLEILSFVPALLSASLLWGGKVAFRWSWLPIAFLIFMVPLPFRLQTALSGQLQAIATQFSTFLLVTLGVPAVSEGNFIIVDEVRIGVVEACSGLGMVMTFVALTAAFLTLYRTYWWVNLGLLLGTFPVAILANVLRITATGILYHLERSESARILYHDLAGWLMIPLGILMIAVELILLQNIIVPVVRPKLDDVLSITMPAKQKASPNPSPTLAKPSELN